MKIDGYVVVPPLNEWDMKKKETIWPAMSYPYFGQTPVEAWKRLIHPSQYKEIDFSTIVQRWHNMGYRVKKAALEIHDE